MTILWPTLTVQNVDASISFYRDNLGFVSDFSLQDANGKTFLGSVEVGDTVIMFESADPSESAWENCGTHSGVSVTICFSPTHDLDALFAKLRGEGVTIVRDIGDSPGAIETLLSVTPMDIN